MVEVSDPSLLLAAFTLFAIQGLGAQRAAAAGSPRAYYIMSSLVAYPAATAVLILSPQIL